VVKSNRMRLIGYAACTGEMINAYNDSEHLKGKNLGIDVNIILIWISNTQNIRLWRGFN
jgi:hypothetical protein